MIQIINLFNSTKLAQRSCTSIETQKVWNLFLQSARLLKKIQWEKNHMNDLHRKCPLICPLETITQLKFRKEGYFDK